MKVNAINNINFDAKKFRLPVRIVKPATSASRLEKSVAKENLVSGVFVREYSNPDAKKFFDKAMMTDDIDKKIYYLDKMGDYKVIDISLEQQVDRFIKSELP